MSEPWLLRDLKEAEAEIERMRAGWDADVEWANKLLLERDEAIEHLRKLDAWGWGEGAPDDARADWVEARKWLVLRALPGEPVAPRKERTDV